MTLHLHIHVHVTCCRGRGRVAGPDAVDLRVGNRFPYTASVLDTVCSAPSPVGSCTGAIPGVVGVYVPSPGGPVLVPGVPASMCTTYGCGPALGSVAGEVHYEALGFPATTVSTAPCGLPLE
jgi:hypothetical protein